MKRFTLLATITLAVSLLAMPAFAEEVDAPEALGLWLNADGTYAVELIPCDEALCATIVWAQDATLVGTTVLGKAMLEPDGKGVHKDGEFTDPLSGKTYYRCEIRVDDERRLRLEGRNGVTRRGRVVLSRFPTTMHWTRVDRAELPTG